MIRSLTKGARRRPADPQEVPPPLPLKVETPGRNGRSRAGRGRLSGLPAAERVLPLMNATVALLEPQALPVTEALPAPEDFAATEELTRINESLRRREQLLMASAKASRLLLEAPDVRAAIPGVLRADRRGGARRPGQPHGDAHRPERRAAAGGGERVDRAKASRRTSAMPRCARAMSAISRPCAPSCAPGAASASARARCGHTSWAIEGVGTKHQGHRADLRRR